MELTAIQAAITSLKAATDITKSILDIKTNSVVQSKVIELQSALLGTQGSALEATNAQFELQEKIKELEEKIRKLEKWDDEKKRYTLVVPWRYGSQVYALKKEDSDGEAPHYLCTNCYENSKKVILNPRSDKDRFISMVCPTCKSSIDTGYRGIGTPKYAEEHSDK